MSKVAVFWPNGCKIKLFDSVSGQGCPPSKANIPRLPAWFLKRRYDTVVNTWNTVNSEYLQRRFQLPRRLLRQQAGQQLRNRMWHKCTCCQSHTHTRAHTYTQNTNCVRRAVVASQLSLKSKQDSGDTKGASETPRRECLMWSQWKTGKQVSQRRELWNDSIEFCPQTPLLSDEFHLVSPTAPVDSMHMCFHAIYYLATLP